jgi:hypothetical protein
MAHREQTRWRPGKELVIQGHLGLQRSGMGMKPGAMKCFSRGKDL